MIRNSRRYLLPNLVIFLGAVLCMLMIGIKRDFCEEYVCYVSSVEDPDYFQEVLVTFDGTYLDYVIRTDSFDGFIDVTRFDLMPEGESYIPDHPVAQIDPWELPITTNYRQMGTIGYFVITSESSYHAIRGSLWAKEDLDEFVMSYMIPIPKDNGTTHWETVGYISYPEPLTAEEAKARMYDYS